MPMAAFGWRQILSLWIHYAPEPWQRERPIPRRATGWQLIHFARIRAIEENNAVLLEACEQRAAEAKARDLALRCVLTIAVLSLLALVASTPTSGPSLIGAVYSWLDELPEGRTVVLVLLAMPALAFAWAVLADRRAEFDEYIQLCEPKENGDRLG